MRLALAWLLGTALFVVGLVLADRWFWLQCGGLASSQYAEVWICGNAPYVRIGAVTIAGLVAGVVARRRGLALGALAALPGLALVTLLYRPAVPFMPLAALLAGAAFFVAPTMVGGVLGARAAAGSWKKAL